MSKEGSQHEALPVLVEEVDELHEFSDKAVNCMDRTGNPCACGCGQATKGGRFLPGHDAKLRATIEDSVGGLLSLDRLVEGARQFVSGRLSSEDYERLTREIIAPTKSA